MRDLLLAELLRFRTWAGVYALGLLIVLGFMSRLVDLGQQPFEVYLAIGAVQALAGLLLALYQFGGYRRPNAWVNLLHRPLPRARIVLALSAAGALLLAFAVLLPLLLLAGWQETMTPRVLDQRHLWLCLAGWNVAVIGYLSGACAVLLPRRCAMAALVFLLLLPAARASGAGALAWQGLVIAWLLAVLLATFKPDLDSAPRGVGAVLVAVPLQVAAWLLFVMAGMGLELAWIAQGSHPNNLPMPPPGSAKEVDNGDGRDVIANGLATSRHPQAALWREQTAISDIATFGVLVEATPQWQELTNQAPMEFDDEEIRVRHVFSHDLRRFSGYRLADQQPVPALGVDGDAPFPSPPLPGPDGLLVGRDTVWQYDADSGCVLTRLKLPAGEVVAGASSFGERLAVLSSRAVYFHDARGLARHDGLLTAEQRLPLPGAIGNLTRIDVLELLDGYLVSFAYTRGRHNGDGPSYQQLLHVDGEGRVEAVSHRELATGYGPLFTWQTWILSPAIHTALHRLRNALAPYQPAYDIAPPVKPRRVVVIAGLLSALSLLGALLHLRRTNLPAPARIAWCLACVLVGLPALSALWLMVRPRELPIAAPEALPAAA